MQFDVDSGNTSEKRKSTETVNIVIAGNLSGRDQQASASGPAEYTAILRELDLYDLDDAIARIQPVVSITSEQGVLNIPVSELDDLHPDALYRRLGLFSTVRQIKSALADPAKAEQALVLASQLTGRSVQHKAEAADEPATGATEKDVFSRLLGKESGGSTATSNAVRSLLRDAVADETVARTPAAVEDMRHALNDLDQEAMRDILRHPAYRDLEMSWRSLEWFSQNIESDEDVQFWLLDTAGAGRNDWSASMPSSIRQALAGERLSLLLVLDEFTDDDESLAMLTAIADASETLACTTIAGADASLAGLGQAPTSLFAVDDSDVSGNDSAGWEALRRRSSASRVGLSYPRMLLRQPYGKRSDPVDSFAFEELESSPDHEAFPWGCSAVGLGAIWIAQKLAAGGPLTTDGIPMVTYDDGSGQAIKPPSEIYISDLAAYAIMKNGVMPLMARRGNTTVSVPRLQSISSDPRSLI